MLEEEMIEEFKIRQIIIDPEVILFVILILISSTDS